MLIDIIASYDTTTKKMLADLRKQMILYIAKHEDSRKILTFLSKCALIGIDENKKTVSLGIPNEFTLQQVKKFFKNILQQAIHDEYNDQFSLELIVYSPLQNGKHELQIDIAKLLKIKEKIAEQKTTQLKQIDKKTAETMQEYF